MEQPNQNTQSPQKPTTLENFEPNVLAAFAYLIPPVSGIIFFLVEKKSKFVRFHAMQSILFGAVAYLLSTLTASLKLLYIGFFLQPLVSFAFFGLWFFLIWKAYQNQEYELPFIGKIAKDQVYKQTPSNKA